MHMLKERIKKLFVTFLSLALAIESVQMSNLTVSAAAYSGFNDPSQATYADTLEVGDFIVGKYIKINKDTVITRNQETQTLGDYINSGVNGILSRYLIHNGSQSFTVDYLKYSNISVYKPFVNYYLCVDDFDEILYNECTNEYFFVYDNLSDDKKDTIDSIVSDYCSLDDIDKSNLAIFNYQYSELYNAPHGYLSTSRPDEWEMLSEARRRYTFNGHEYFILPTDSSFYDNLIIIDVANGSRKPNANELPGMFLHTDTLEWEECFYNDIYDFVHILPDYFVLNGGYDASIIKEITIENNLLCITFVEMSSVYAGAVYYDKIATGEKIEKNPNKNSTTYIFSRIVTSGDYESRNSNLYYRLLDPNGNELEASNGYSITFSSGYSGYGYGSYGSFATGYVVYIPREYFSTYGADAVVIKSVTYDYMLGSYVADFQFVEPTEIDIRYVDYYTGENIHTQHVNFENGELPVHYTNDSYSLWIDEDGNIADDTTVSLSTVLYGIPQNVDIPVYDGETGDDTGLVIKGSYSDYSNYNVEYIASFPSELTDVYDFIISGNGEEITNGDIVYYQSVKYYGVPCVEQVGATCLEVGYNQYSASQVPISGTYRESHPLSYYINYNNWNRNGNPIGNDTFPIPKSVVFFNLPTWDELSDVFDDITEDGEYSRLVVYGDNSQSLKVESNYGSVTITAYCDSCGYNHSVTINSISNYYKEEYEEFLECFENSTPMVWMTKDANSSYGKYFYYENGYGNNYELSDQCKNFTDWFVLEELVGTEMSLIDALINYSSGDSWNTYTLNSDLAGSTLRWYLPDTEEELLDIVLNTTATDEFKISTDNQDFYFSYYPGYSLHCDLRVLGGHGVTYNYFLDNATGPGYIDFDLTDLCQVHSNCIPVGLTSRDEIHVKDQAILDMFAVIVDNVYTPMVPFTKQVPTDEALGHDFGNWVVVPTGSVTQELLDGADNVLDFEISDITATNRLFKRDCSRGDAYELTIKDEITITYKDYFTKEVVNTQVCSTTSIVPYNNSSYIAWVFDNADLGINNNGVTLADDSACTTDSVLYGIPEYVDIPVYNGGTGALIETVHAPYSGPTDYSSITYKTDISNATVSTYKYFVDCEDNDITDEGDVFYHNGYIVSALVQTSQTDATCVDAGQKVYEITSPDLQQWIPYDDFAKPIEGAYIPIDTNSDFEYMTTPSVFLKLGTGEDVLNNFKYIIYHKDGEYGYDTYAFVYNNLLKADREFIDSLCSSISGSQKEAFCILQISDTGSTYVSQAIYKYSGSDYYYTNSSYVYNNYSTNDMYYALKYSDGYNLFGCSFFDYVRFNGKKYSLKDKFPNVTTGRYSPDNFNLVPYDDIYTQQYSYISDHQTKNGEKHQVRVKYPTLEELYELKTLQDNCNYEELYIKDNNGNNLYIEHAGSFRISYNNGENSFYGYTSKLSSYLNLDSYYGYELSSEEKAVFDAYEEFAKEGHYIEIETGTSNTEFSWNLYEGKAFSPFYTCQYAYDKYHSGESSMNNVLAFYEKMAEYVEVKVPFARKEVLPATGHSSTMSDWEEVDDVYITSTLFAEAENNLGITKQDIGQYDILEARYCTNSCDQYELKFTPHVHTYDNNWEKVLKKDTKQKLLDGADNTLDFTLADVGSRQTLYKRLCTEYGDAYELKMTSDYNVTVTYLDYFTGEEIHTQTVNILTDFVVPYTNGDYVAWLDDNGAVADQSQIEYSTVLYGVPKHVVAPLKNGSTGNVITGLLMTYTGDLACQNIKYQIDIPESVSEEHEFIIDTESRMVTNGDIVTYYKGYECYTLEYDSTVDATCTEDGYDKYVAAVVPEETVIDLEDNFVNIKTNSYVVNADSTQTYSDSYYIPLGIKNTVFNFEDLDYIIKARGYYDSSLINYYCFSYNHLSESDKQYLQDVGMHPDTLSDDYKEGLAVLTYDGSYWNISGCALKYQDYYGNFGLNIGYSDLIQYINDSVCLKVSPLSTVDIIQNGESQDLRDYIAELYDRNSILSTEYVSGSYSYTAYTCPKISFGNIFVKPQQVNMNCFGDSENGYIRIDMNNASSWASGSYYYSVKKVFELDNGLGEKLIFQNASPTIIHIKDGQTYTYDGYSEIESFVSQYEDGIFECRISKDGYLKLNSTYFENLVANTTSDWTYSSRFTFVRKNENTYYDIIDAIGHDFLSADWVEIPADSSEYTNEFITGAENDANFTIEDITSVEVLQKRLCENASDAYEVRKTLHTCVAGTPAEEDTVDPDCTSQGTYNTVARCTICNEIMSSVPGTRDALGHTWSDNDWTEVPFANIDYALLNGAENDLGMELDEIMEYDTLEKRVCSRNSDAYELRYVVHTHSAGTPVKKNEVLPTCLQGGGYDMVANCEFCGALMTTEHTDIQATGHNFADTWATVNYEDITQELLDGANNDFEITLDSVKNYDELQSRLCQNGCGAYELRYNVHTCQEGSSVLENVVYPTCVAGGSSDSVIYCTVCEAELSRTPLNTGALGHDWTANWQFVEHDDRTQELVDGAENANEINFEQIHNKALYIRYCNRAGDAYKLALVDHTPDNGVVSNESNATCTTDGGYDTIYTCTDCGEVLETVHTTHEALGHTWNTSDWAEVNANDINQALLDNAENNLSFVLSDIEEHDVLYKRLCSRAQDAYELRLDKHTHTSADAVEENRVEPGCTSAGKYDSVVKCSECGEELSRTEIILNPLGHTWDDDSWTFVNLENVNPQLSSGSVFTPELVLGAYELVGFDMSELQASFDAFKASLCSEDRISERQCSRAGDAYELKLEMHTCEAGIGTEVERIEPTCTEDGEYKTLVKCVYCEKELSKTPGTIDALGHEWADFGSEDWVLVKNITEDVFNGAEELFGIPVQSYEDLENYDVFKANCSRNSDAYALLVKEMPTGTVFGLVCDDDGNPIKNAKVVLHSVERVTYTDENGLYRFDDVEKDDHILQIYVGNKEVAKIAITMDDVATAEITDKNGFDADISVNEMDVEVKVAKIKIPKPTPTPTPTPTPNPPAPVPPTPVPVQTETKITSPTTGEVSSYPALFAIISSLLALAYVGLKITKKDENN